MRAVEFWHATWTWMRETGERVAHALAGSVVAVAFWVAVAVPFLTLGHLVAGVRSSDDIAVFVIHVAVNLVALGVGHRYRHPDTDVDGPGD
jgi:putative flippase GtrA